MCSWSIKNKNWKIIDWLIVYWLIDTKLGLSLSKLKTGNAILVCSKSEQAECTKKWPWTKKSKCIKLHKKYLSSTPRQQGQKAFQVKENIAMNICTKMALKRTVCVKSVVHLLVCHSILRIIRIWSFLLTRFSCNQTNRVQLRVNCADPNLLLTQGSQKCTLGSLKASNLWERYLLVPRLLAN